MNDPWEGPLMRWSLMIRESQRERERERDIYTYVGQSQTMGSNSHRVGISYHAIIM